MMEANKVEMISKEMIKPSFPTPPPLRIHKLSLLDHISPPVFIPLIFFYQHDQLFYKLESLKQSLSHALIRFYPLAGRLNHNNYSIDCNDAGVQFIVAQVHGYNLSEVIQTPKMEQLREFLPSVRENDDVLVAVQVNLFDFDEGVAIGVCMSHKVGDGSSIVTFVNSWAAIARGAAEIVQPNFNLASTLFPPIDLSNSSYQSSIGMVKKDKIFTTRRFVFDKEKLDALKKSASSRSLVKDPTRVEALSAFLWKEASKLNKDCNKKLFAAVHAVNIRSRMNNPTIPDYFFGNLWTVTLAFSEMVGSSNNSTDHDLVYQLRNAIRKIDSDYINMLQNGQDFMKHMGKFVELFSKGEVEFCNFTSWCRFPVYEVDFGWGKPVWVCTTTFPYENMIIFLSTKCGEGIEAWVNMLEDDGDFIGNSIIAK